MKPSKPEIHYLKTVSDLASVISDSEPVDYEISDWRIKDAVMSGVKKTYLHFSNVIFDHCSLTDCNYENSSFTNVRFQACDLSNCNFSESLFRQCSFLSCKCIGTNFFHSKQQDVTYLHTGLQYANFDTSTFDRAAFENSDCQNTDFRECKFENIYLKDVNFRGASFLRTPLKGIDFSSCQIAGICVLAECKELKGAKIDFSQAAELIKLFGLEVD